MIACRLFFSEWSIKSPISRLIFLLRKKVDSFPQLFSGWKRSVRFYHPGVEFCEMNLLCQLVKFYLNRENLNIQAEYKMIFV